MKPQDIRIGNLVYDSLRNKEVQIQLKHFKELYISEKMFFERYKAIKLTEEKLLAFGFNRGAYDNFYICIRNDNGLSDYLSVSKDFECEMYFINHRFSGDIEEEKFLVTAQYAHQLQNLYFSLKNKELPIA